MIPIPTFTITTNTLSIIVKGRVANILKSTSTSCTITSTITSFIFMKTIINMNRSTRCTQQYIMVTWFMGGRVAGMGPISTSQITTNSLSNVVRGISDGIFRPISTSDIINFYITPQVATIATYILSSHKIITTDTPLLISMTTISTSLVLMKISIHRTRRK